VPPILPPSRPLQPLTASERFVRQANVTHPVVLLGMRGYYRDSMGKPGVNDRGIYDDAMFVISRSAHVAFNANTDPSITRKGVAVLEPGVWWYEIGRHKRFSPFGYTALVQAAPVTVRRDEQELDTGWFGINIHRGARRSTSSLGCQTVWDDQYDAFIELVQSEMKRCRVGRVPYVLVEEQG
jgi:hypothetical protein